jgi:hypothetical protein
MAAMVEAAHTAEEASVADSVGSAAVWAADSVEAERAEDGSKKVKAENLKLKNQERSQK